MTDKHELVPAPEEEAQQTVRVPNHEFLKLASWVWVDENETDEDSNANVKRKKWFACITHIGSNYIKVEGPSGRYMDSMSYQRIHFDEIDACIELEKNPDKVIQKKCAYYQGRVRKYLGQAKEILARLGIKDQLLLSQQTQESTTALAVASQVGDINKHKAALVKAEKETLPKIFEKVKNANAGLAQWSGVKILEMEALVGRVESKVGEIKSRIRTVSLYAGLTEHTKLVKKGNPAAADEKLHIMQRKCYMDEESLLDYTLGGMDFASMKGFERWLSKKKNFHRIFPFPKTMVCFQVRRHVKKRTWDGSFAGVFWLMREAKADKFTYLYVRNGSRLYRVTTEMEFKRRIFPGKNELIIGEKMRGSKAFDMFEMITEREYQEILRERKEKQAKSDIWEKENPKESHISNPYRSWDRDPEDEYEPYDPSSVYYDDMDNKIKTMIEDYNLVAYIVQGLFDRSEILHPHPPVQLWSAGGFEAAIKLIYDDDMVLAPSEAPPSWADYVAGCNASLKKGSVTIGHERQWLRREAKKYNDAVCRSRYYTQNFREVEEHKPWNDPGPGRIARIGKWQPKSKRAVYYWERERSYHSKQRNWRSSDTIPEKIQVSAEHLFNLDAYKPGDYLQFFKDPRTRTQYLKWVNYLLSAEEYHAGNPEFQPRNDIEDPTAVKR